MASPPPTDAYQVLGVSEDAVMEAIRSAHRKLGLKHSLSDPIKRARYDEQVKLATSKRRVSTIRQVRGRPALYPGGSSSSDDFERKWESLNENADYIKICSPEPTVKRSASIQSRRSSRNSSLRGGVHFEREYQNPEFVRPRAGSGSDVSLSSRGKLSRELIASSML